MYKLDNSDPLIAYEAAFLDIYNEKYSKIKPNEGQPIAVFCAGQPGSGKSAMTELVENRLKEAIIIDTDTFRTFHPKYADVMNQTPDLAYEILDDFTYKASDKLIELAISEKKNLIFDGTMGGNNIEKTIETAKKLKEAGYHIEIAALSVNPEVSITGTFFRYESQMKKKIPGRTVTPEYHNEVYCRIPHNIEKLLSNNIVDDGCVYGRSYTNKELPLIESLSLKNETNITIFKDAFNKERERRLEPFEFASMKSFKNATSELIINRLQNNSKECSALLNKFNDSCRSTQELNNSLKKNSQITR